MPDFFDTIQEDVNARQSSRARYAANERSSQNLCTVQTREPATRRIERNHEEQGDDDFFADYPPQQSRRPQQQRYASEQNISNTRNGGQAPIRSNYAEYNSNNSRYASQASIPTARNPYFERASAPKPSKSRPIKTNDEWEEEEDEDNTFPRAPSGHQFARGRQEEAVSRPNPIHSFASDLRQGLEETGSASRGRSERNGAPAGRPPKPVQFSDFGDEDEGDGVPILRQPEHQQARMVPPSVKLNGYSALGHKENHQQRQRLFDPTQSGVDSFSRRDPKERREKFKPVALSATELFNERMHIKKGTRFDEIYGTFEVQVTGGDDTKPKIESFDTCNFSDEILKNLKLLKYSMPTPIQKHVIPLVQNKSNSIMGNAETGSGKTAAFILPIINEIQQKKRLEELSSKGGLPYCLVLEPTRDLAEQVNRDTSAFANQTGVVITVTYGETSVHEDRREIERGCDILIMTIGRLCHFIQDGIVKLHNLQYLILDETDKLLKGDFEKVIVELVIQSPDLRQDYRTFMFSATIDEDVQRFISQYISDSAFCVSVGEVNHAASTIDQKFIEVKKYEKEDLLLEILKEAESTKKRLVPGDSEREEYIPERTVVFVAHKRQSDRVAISLARQGFNVISLNADRTAKQRWEAIYKFKMDTYQVLVATDVASRGLNLPEVQHVINLDLPMHEQMSYIHRIGRTGRAGNSGHATSFFDPGSPHDIENAPFYVRTLRIADIEVPPFLQQIVDYRDESQFELNRLNGISAQQNCY